MCVLAYIEFSTPRYPVRQLRWCFLGRRGTIFSSSFLTFVLLWLDQMRNTLPDCWTLGRFLSVVIQSLDRKIWWFVLLSVFSLVFCCKLKPVMIRLEGCWILNVEKHLIWLGRSEAFTVIHIISFVLFLIFFFVNVDDEKQNQNTVIPGLGFLSRCWVFCNLTHHNTVPLLFLFCIFILWSVVELVPCQGSWRVTWPRSSYMLKMFWAVLSRSHKRGVDNKFVQRSSWWYQNTQEKNLFFSLI